MNSSALPSLDDLFREAKQQLVLKKKLDAGGKPAQKTEVLDASLLFSNPENWRRTRGVALIHEETETLLGNFSEYVHRTVPNCRRLVRERDYIVVSVVERVSGNWWLGVDRRPEPRQTWHEKRPAILHIHLDKLRVHAPICEVVVCLSYGGITRVELALDTMFSQEDGKQEQLLFFPAGTNILGEMSLDSKIKLHAELGAT